MIWSTIANLVDEEQCARKGFNPSLTCGSCESLAQFQLQILNESCNECCQKTADAVITQKYRKANLVVCR
uniref:Uncharacterized protein n=1 Tax=Romanomermis culicivorax TaxID=13658 RepID=A0A915JKA8_ROMCU